MPGHVEPEGGDAGLDPQPAAAGLPGMHRLYRDEVRHALRELGLTFELLTSHGVWDDTVPAEPFVDANGNGTWDRRSVGDRVCNLGLPSDIPLTGMVVTDTAARVLVVYETNTAAQAVSMRVDLTF